MELVMFALPQSAVLLIIDVQKGFDCSHWGTERNNLDAESKIATMLEVWRQTARPIVHIRHMSTEHDSPLRPGQSGNEFKEFAQPRANEIVFEKTVNSAFIGTKLEQHLHQIKCEALVIVGLTTDHCISTTTRMAGNLGFNTFVVADATATFNRLGYDGANYPAEHVHALALASLHHEFATVITTQEVLNSLTAQHSCSS
jgi:nicotinamidase-related amidase